MEELRPLTDDDEYNFIKGIVKKDGLKFPQGQFLHSGFSGKNLILMDPKSPIYKNKDIYDMVHNHEVTHAIRWNKQGPGVKLQNHKNRALSAIGVFIEELAAQNRMYKRHPAPLKYKIKDYLYPIESGVGRLLDKNIRFDKLRKYITGKLR